MTNDSCISLMRSIITSIEALSRVLPAFRGHIITSSSMVICLIVKRLLPRTCSNSCRKGIHCCKYHMRHRKPCVCRTTVVHFNVCLRSNWSCSHSQEHVQLQDDISRRQFLQWRVISRPQNTRARASFVVIQLICP